METARAPRIGGAVGALGTPSPALGPGVSRIGTASRQRNELTARRTGQLVGPHHQQPVDGRGQVLAEFSGQVRRGVGTGHEIRYQAASTAHGGLPSRVANPRVTLYPVASTEIAQGRRTAPRVSGPGRAAGPARRGACPAWPGR